MTIEEEIKTALSNNKVLIGTRTVMKELKTGKLNSVIISNNCPERIKKDLYHYNGIIKIEIKEFSGSGNDLGVLCGKPFGISVLGIKN